MRGKIINWWRSERGRKWAGELANIILGVLIALMLGAVATWIGWKIDVADARQSIGEELGEIAGQGKYRERAYDCVERKLDSIATILDSAEQGGRLPPLGELREPGWLSWSNGVWTSVIGADIGSHLSRSELDNLAGVYEMLDIISGRSADEIVTWTKLYAIVGPGRAISPDEIRDLRADVTDARAQNRQIVAASIRIQQSIDAFDLPVNRATIAQYGNAGIGSFCAPIAPPNGKPYGQAPAADVVKRVIARPTTRDETGLPQR